jgi:hypothetical protein
MTLEIPQSILDVVDKAADENPDEMEAVKAAYKQVRRLDVSDAAMDALIYKSIEALVEAARERQNEAMRTAARSASALKRRGFST